MNNKEWSPTNLSEFIGQRDLIRQLEVEIKAAKMSNRQLRHMVFGGPQGVGKTLLAKLVAKEAGGNPPVEVIGKGLTHEGLTKILLDFTSDGYEKGGYLVYPERATRNTLVLDEGDQCPAYLLNLLHSVLDPTPDGRRIFQAKHSRGQVEPLWVVGFTCIIISNYIGSLAEKSAPTLSRFPIQYTFEWYTEEEIASTIRQYSSHLGVPIAEDAIQLLAKRSNGMPRAAISLFRRAMDFSMTQGNSSSVSARDVESMLGMVGIDNNGLDRSMTRYLKALNDHPSGRLSLQSLQGILDVDASTLQYCIEPILLKRNFIIRCSNGRELTNAGRAALGLAGGNPDDKYFSRRIA